jgi:hypothetical protein
LAGRCRFGAGGDVSAVVITATLLKIGQIRRPLIQIVVNTIRATIKIPGSADMLMA